LVTWWNLFPVSCCALLTVIGIKIPIGRMEARRVLQEYRTRPKALALNDITLPIPRPDKKVPRRERCQRPFSCPCDLSDLFLPPTIATKRGASRLVLGTTTGLFRQRPLAFAIQTPCITGRMMAFFSSWCRRAAAVSGCKGLDQMLQRVDQIYA
jgi:hypothetical protein